MAIPRVLLKKILLIRKVGFECEEVDGLYEWAKQGTQILTANSRQKSFRYRRHIFETDVYFICQQQFLKRVTRQWKII